MVNIIFANICTDVSVFWCCVVGEEEKWIIQSSTSISHCITSSHEQFHYSSARHRFNPETQCYPKAWYNTSAQIRYYRDAQNHHTPQTPNPYCQTYSNSITFHSKFNLKTNLLAPYLPHKLRKANGTLAKANIQLLKNPVFCALLLLLLHSSNKMLSQSWCAAVGQWPLCSWGRWRSRWAAKPFHQQGYSSLSRVEHNEKESRRVGQTHNLTYL